MASKGLSRALYAYVFRYIDIYSCVDLCMYVFFFPFGVEGAPGGGAAVEIRWALATDLQACREQISSHHADLARRGSQASSGVDVFFPFWDGGSLKKEHIKRIKHMDKTRTKPASPFFV